MTSVKTAKKFVGIADSYFGEKKSKTIFSILISI